MSEIRKKRRGTAARVVDAGLRLKQLVSIAASGVGLTGGRAPAGPLHAQIGVSDPCNHRCVMCWDHPPAERESAATADRFGQGTPGLMSLETFCKIVEDLRSLGTRRIDLVGRGEPLLHPELDRMVAFAKSRSMLVTLCTNASRLSRERAERLVDAGLDRANVSLNAGTPETYPAIHVSETPENYRQVKRNLRYLADYRNGSESPHVRLSFVISSRNYFELLQMVEVVREVGAQEAMFTHTVVHEATPDLALTRPQYEDLLEAAVRAKSRAADLGVQTNLSTFSATVPSYLQGRVEGPPVVPCYVGWYFTVILGNGAVMPCCQCSQAIDRVSESRRFADVWSSTRYREFRKAAKGLPSPSERLRSCECDRCMLRPRNISIHNMLHPWSRIEGGDGEQLFTLRDLLRMRKVDRS